MDVNTSITGDTSIPDFIPEPEPVQEAIIRTWDGIRFEEDINPTPPDEPHPEPEIEEDVDYLIFNLITSHNKEPLETSLKCQYCGKSSLIYFIHQWNNSRMYKGRRYAFTELLCTKCGSARLHALYGPNDIEYYYLGIKHD